MGNSSRQSSVESDHEGPAWTSDPLAFSGLFPSTFQIIVPSTGSLNSNVAPSTSGPETGYTFRTRQSVGTHTAQTGSDLGRSSLPGPSVADSKDPETPRGRKRAASEESYLGDTEGSQGPKSSARGSRSKRPAKSSQQRRSRRFSPKTALKDQASDDSEQITEDEGDSEEETLLEKLHKWAKKLKQLDRTVKSDTEKKELSIVFESIADVINLYNKPDQMVDGQSMYEFMLKCMKDWVNKLELLCGIVSSPPKKAELVAVVKDMRNFIVSQGISNCKH